MKNENFIGVYDNIFSPEHCDYIIDFYNKNSQLNSTVLANANNLRKDNAITMSDVMGSGTHSDVIDINDKLTSALMMYADEFPILKEIAFASYAIKLQKTTPGGGYHIWHCEQSGFEVSSRILVWTVYLNDIEDGGETEFLYQSTRVKPKKGSVCFFPASFTHTHRGNPPLKEDKYIATGWYYLKPE